MYMKKNIYRFRDILVYFISICFGLPLGGDKTWYDYGEADKLLALEKRKPGKLGHGIELVQEELRYLLQASHWNPIWGAWRPLFQWCWIWYRLVMPRSPTCWWNITDFHDIFDPMDCYWIDWCFLSSLTSFSIYSVCYGVFTHLHLCPSSAAPSHSSEGCDPSLRLQPASCL